MNEACRKAPQNDAPNVNIPIGSVGIDHYKTPIRLIFGRKHFDSTAEISASVDLPLNMRGAHLSKIIIPVISEIGRSDEDTFKLVNRISRLILESNAYSSKALLKLSTQYLRELHGPDDLKSYAPYLIEYSSESRQGGMMLNCIMLETTIFTACPCTMEGSRSILAERFPEHSAFLASIPAVTHNQRNRLAVTISNYKSYNPDPDEIIESIESVTGKPLSAIRTERETDKFVLEAHESPRFVEDVVRDVARAICREIENLEDSAIIKITSRSEESLHNHDAYAEIELTAGEIRKYSRNQ